MGLNIAGWQSWFKDHLEQRRSRVAFAADCYNYWYKKPDTDPLRAGQMNDYRKQISEQGLNSIVWMQVGEAMEFHLRERLNFNGLTEVVPLADGGERFEMVVQEGNRVATISVMASMTGKTLALGKLEIAGDKDLAIVAFNLTPDMVWQ